MKPELSAKTRIPELLRHHQSAVLEEWLRAGSRGTRGQRLSEVERREQSRSLLEAITQAAQQSGVEDVSGPGWSSARDSLSELSKSDVKAGFTPADTARFVFALKEALFSVLRREYASDPKALADETWVASLLLDNLGLLTTDMAIKSREDIASRQQQELLELSTPVVKLWKGIVAVPLIGTLDSERTQIVMESLLQQVVENEAAIAIIDITGVPTVDTLVAQHLLKTIAAARLMGSDCIISGIRPQIAATIVHLGVDLGNVITKATLADALALALRRMGLIISAKQARRVAEGDHGTNSDS